ncbi:hypothetical protein X471_00937 [Bartonella bacilliformis str. Heidi Mejia]|uniref:AprI/Inh family metalloprotease inhibitor n=1 Tax=Bartonella bacilliformis TaxID=774 RepID=UPI00044B4A97|nr:AprI/Inh family metalloprotease inhibitor [Bartonella bacilliformis]EYS90804.1 hypothetical protein X471_00937 [Bartonella bacilliformis str. Heidi Mejia]KEG17981.1 hypothetical protein H705_00020 [Bartonella bacilliformis Cond044]KEG20595.1 hypothetical protein H707_00020 [Bartonella bacilliformis Hosp800-02]KEG24700.1 hypothetical protein H703_00020 [Bartonella bacilliformis Ver075]KEG25002.1 hypothetical protein H708_00020 [Bartonella bacilliformis VAB9028]
MTFSKISSFIILSLIVILSGCSTPRFKSDSSTPDIFYPFYSAETASDSIITSDLPESGEFTSVDEKESPDDFSQMANFEPPSYAINLSPASIAGVWNLSVDNTVCRVATPQTKFGQGYSARPLSCSKMFSEVRSWAVKGKKLYFYEGSGRVVAVFYSFNGGRFEGYMFNNQPAILTR